MVSAKHVIRDDVWRAKTSNRFCGHSSVY
jgi:hypothetical protein